ncbi:MAG TPA: AcrB/AcrD/AcrF family protein [Allosphingosinicella sp.]
MPGKGVGEFEFLDRQWRRWLLLLWVIVAGYMLFDRWPLIRIFALGDTDDNMRIMQVRALLAGQNWYDLAQHRLAGSNIHWSRLVDLPIAGLKLAFTPLLGGRIAEQIAVAVAPLLPMGVTMAAIAVTVRRLVAPLAYPLAIALLVTAGSTNGMFQPLRIDHHGWQLAMLAWAMASLTDARRMRGGITLGIATALSLVIGMEMLLYLAVAGTIAVLMWVRDREESRRLFAYGVSLAGGCSLGYLVFASRANSGPVCDALSPVWLSAMVVAGAVAILLAMKSPATRWGRFAAAAAAGLAVAGAFALAWPHCLGRLEQSTPELDRLWLSKVREAMPIWRHGMETTILTVTLPVFGLIGYAMMLWRERRDPARMIPWAAIAALAALAAALLCWQTRAGPAAQLLSIAGVTALAWFTIQWVMGLKYMLARVFGVAAAFLFISGIAANYLSPQFFRAPLSQTRRTVNIANNRCPTLAALAPIARQPRGMVMTFVDLGPRLIAVTPHDAITGPYHRNGSQIIDVMHAWRGDAANALRTARKYHADYVLICPNLSESTIYRAEAPGGFYMQLMANKVPHWLQTVPLPTNSPYRMWRVVG